MARESGNDRLTGTSNVWENVITEVERKLDCEEKTGAHQENAG